jgi:hypothetical protein
MNEIRKIADDFSDLSAKKHLASRSFINHGNVMKYSPEDSPQVQPEAEQQSKKGEPEIIIHREEEMVTRIEFICPCGQHTEVHFDYDGS